MTETTTLQWNFPGGIWGMLAAVAGSLFLVWKVYGLSLRHLSPRWRGVLIALRASLLVLLIVCLGSPQRVLTRKSATETPRPIAVLVDTSGSMVRSDGSEPTRLALAQQALHEFWEPGFKLYTFAEKLEPLAGPESLPSYTDPNRETHLLSSLNQILQSAPPQGWGGVVVLTDGADTTRANAEEVGHLFRENRVPLLVGATRTNLAQSDLIEIASVNLPPTHIVNTEFPLEVFVRTATDSPGQATIRILQNDQSVGETTLPISPGSHTMKASFSFNQATPGSQDYQVQVWAPGEAKPRDALYVTTQAIPRPEMKVLYYAGALNVELRFLRAAFDEHPSIKIESAIHISPSALRRQVPVNNGAPLPTDSTDSSDPNTFPATEDALNQYQVIVLADLLPSQLDERQTQALLDYVRDGGGLIFLEANTVAASDFSGHKLEELLPVVFEPKAEEASGSGPTDAATALRERLQDLEGTEGAENEQDQATHMTSSRLTSMQFTGDGEAVLGRLGKDPEEQRPMFREYAAVQRAKPGAIVAAQHPTDKNGWGQRPLLTMQHFGRGRSAVLATDSLWRWQLRLPSTSEAYRKLWQQMLLWVADQSPTIPEVRMDPPVAREGETVKVSLDLTGKAILANKPSLSLVTADAAGKTENLTLAPSSEDSRILTATLTAPKSPWVRLSVDFPDQSRSVGLLTIMAATVGLEDKHLKPDLTLLHQLAASAGGQYREVESLHHLLPLGSEGESEVIEKKATDLWNNPFLFGAILALFATELLFRRLLKLI